MPDSKKKGSRNERGVANLLKTWTNYEFARTPQSGGLHWRKQHTSGDIVCIDDIHGAKFPFSIECKFHESFDMLHLLDDTVGKKANKIMSFWEQSEGDSIKYNKIPLVFMRRNGMKSGTHFVIMPTNFYNLWNNELEGWEYRYGVIHFTNSKHSFTIINSEDIVLTDYSKFYKIGRMLRRKLLKIKS